MKPSPPVNRKADCQLKVWEIQTATAANMTPKLLAPLKIPVASARSFFGNHSATAFTEAGQLAASPAPRKNRAIQNWNTVRHIAWPIAADAHTTTATAKHNRPPRRSTRRPVKLI